VAAAREAVAQYDGIVEATRKGDHAYRAKSMETSRDEGRAWLSFAEGKNEEALSLLRSIADKQDAFGKGESSCRPGRCWLTCCWSWAGHGKR